jgi:uncharacterized protein (TIGR02145 family)
MYRWIVLTLITMFLFTGCGDLEPEMQDTRTVILNMDYNQKSSSRSSSSVSASDLIPYNTHLILALPSWEYLTSNYNNFYSSFGQGLRNTADKKVSLEIPLNTQMKIFAFLFRENYSEDDLFSAIREVGYYGESQIFSINTQTNNLSLGITLIQVTSTGTNDTTAPTASVITATITASGNANVQSTETGTAYLVNTAVTVSNLGSITGADDNLTNSVIINLANTDTMLSTTGLLMGTYKVYTEDAAGNLSGPSSDTVSIAGLVDIEGNAYSTVVIGTQHWMAENLKVTKYINGDNITHITTDSDWTNDTDGAYGYYDDNTTLRDTYGMLYNWYAVDNSSSRYICPEGWHVPSKVEYDALETYLGSGAGGQMKETGTDHWDSTNSGTTNSSGFNARGGGYRIYSNGIYVNVKLWTYFWTATKSISNSIYANYLGLRGGGSDWSKGESFKKYGFSVRCLED